MTEHVDHPPANPETSGAIIVYNPEATAPPKPGAIKAAGSWMQDYVTAIKNGRFHPFTKTERKARAATRNQPWGPTGAELTELARLSLNPVDCTIILGVTELRLGYPPKRWRNVYKGLSVLEFLIKRGSDAVVTRATDMIPKLISLTSFAYITTDGKDVGDNVRHRARAIHALLADPERLRAERTAIAQKHGALAGVGSGAGGPTVTNGHLMKGNGEAATAVAVANGDGDGEGSKAGALRNAGETKGVTLEENKRHVAALKRLLARPENKFCADCASPGAGHRPTWASITCGVFICMRCAGAHRGLGTHISQVRSCTLDTWLPSQVAFLAGCGGNITANAYWEAQLPATGKPPVSTGSDLEAFVRRKYAEKAYALPDGEWPPLVPFEDEETKEILEGILSEEERAARAAAKEAALLAKDQGRDQGGVDQEGDGDVAAGSEEGKDDESKEAGEASTAAQLPDLINLMDFDFDIEPTPAPAPPTENGVDANGGQNEIEELNPLQALENLFTDQPAVAQGPVDPYAIAQPPSSLQSWDMGAVFQVQQAQQQQQQAAQAAPQPQANGGFNSYQQPIPTTAAGTPYLPPWAPQPHVTMPHTGSYSTESTAAAVAFTAGFSAVPQQFTSAPVLPPPPFPMVINPHGGPAGNGVSSGIQGNGMGYHSHYHNQQQQQGNRALQPHEALAQKMVFGGLDNLTTHADLVAVKSPQKPEGTPPVPAQAMKNTASPEQQRQSHHQMQQYQQQQYYQQQQMQMQYQQQQQYNNPQQLQQQFNAAMAFNGTSPVNGHYGAPSGNGSAHGSAASGNPFQF